MDNSKVIPEQEQQPAAAPQLGLNDLAAVVQMIDIVSRRGAFEGPELTAIGALRGRFEAFVKASTPKPTEEPKQEAPAPAKA
jgi:hypothetical protein